MDNKLLACEFKYLNYLFTYTLLCYKHEHYLHLLYQMEPTPMCNEVPASATQEPTVGGWSLCYQGSEIQTAPSNHTVNTKVEWIIQ